MIKILKLKKKRIEIKKEGIEEKRIIDKIGRIVGRKKYGVEKKKMKRGMVYKIMKKRLEKIKKKRMRI